MDSLAVNYLQNMPNAIYSAVIVLVFLMKGVGFRVKENEEIRREISVVAASYVVLTDSHLSIQYKHCGFGTSHAKCPIRQKTATCVIAPLRNPVIALLLACLPSGRSGRQ